MPQGSTALWQWWAVYDRWSANHRFAGLCCVDWRKDYRGTIHRRPSVLGAMFTIF